MFKLVLLALADASAGSADDGENRRTAVQVASSLAARHGAGFAVQHVSGPVGQEGGCVLQLPGEEDLALRRAEVEALLREVMPPGLTADVVTSAGFAHLEILKAARILGPDLLVLGNLDDNERCRRELSDSQSSAAALVANGAAIPVLVVPSGASAVPGPFVSILTAVDLSEDPALTRALLVFASRLAAREGANLHLLHTLRLPPDEPTPGHDEMVRRIAAARDRLSYLCQGLPGSNRTRFVVSEGMAEVELLKHVRERKADLLVLPRPDCQDEGKSAALARVLQGARCPVLLVGPQAQASQALSNQPQHSATAARG